MLPLHRALGFALVLASFTVVAAQPSQRSDDTKTRQIYVSAVDNKGAPVTGLTIADFVVKEDGATREVIDVKLADAPLHIAVLIDDSAAATDATSYLRDGLIAMLERLRGKGEIALITIGERPTVLAQYSKDTEPLNQQVRRIFPRTGAGAYLLEGIVEASRGLAKREADRKVILAITFEGVEYSNQQYDQVLRELQKSGAALHVVAIGTPSSSLNDEMRNRGMVLAEGTSRTGGRRDQVLALSGIPDKLKQAADELVNQYLVTYGRPDKLVPPDKISVTSPQRNITVRARTRTGER